MKNFKSFIIFWVLAFSLFLVGCNSSAPESSATPQSRSIPENSITQGNNKTNELDAKYYYEDFAGTYSTSYTMPASNYPISTEVGDRTFIRIWSDNTAVFITEMLGSTYYCDANYVFANNIYSLTLFYGDTMELVFDNDKNELIQTSKQLYYDEFIITTYTHLQTGIETGIKYYEGKASLTYNDYLMENIEYTEYSMEIVYTLNSNGTGSQRFYVDGVDLIQYFIYESSFVFNVQENVINFSLTKSKINFIAQYDSKGFIFDLTNIENEQIANFFARIMSKTSSPVNSLAFSK